MSRAPKITAFSGSLRAESFNHQLVSLFARLAESSGAEVQLITLSDYSMPIFNEDQEKELGMPEGVQQFKKVLRESDGFLISSPEYNSSLTAALKNAIDWASRPVDGEGPLAAFADKTAAIMSASPGALGGLRGLASLRSILSSIRVTVLPDQLAVGSAFNAFDEEGSLKDEKLQKRAEEIAKRLVDVTARLL